MYAILYDLKYIPQSHHNPIISYVLYLSTLPDNSQNRFEIYWFRNIFKLILKVKLIN